LKRKSCLKINDNNVKDQRERMRTYYKISSEETGMVLLRKRKIAKALRRWLRENGHIYEYTYFSA